VLEGLRLRMDGELHIVNRGLIVDAACHALGPHKWLTTPNFGQEGMVKSADLLLEGNVRGPKSQEKLACEAARAARQARIARCASQSPQPQ
jgi:hypothetical protein